MKAEKDQPRRKHSGQKACKNKAQQLKRGWHVASSVFVLQSFNKTPGLDEAKSLLSFYLTGQREITLHLMAPSQLSFHYSRQFALLLPETSISELSLLKTLNLPILLFSTNELTSSERKIEATRVKHPQLPTPNPP